MSYDLGNYPNVRCYLEGSRPQYAYPQVGEYKPKGNWIVARKTGTKNHLVDRAMMLWDRDGQATTAVRAKCGYVFVQVGFTLDPVAADYCDECLFCDGFGGGPYVVYRFWGHDESLLYVGYTSALLRRLAGHVSASPWWPEVANARYVEFTDELSARRAERDAIEQELPKYNIFGKPVAAEPLKAEDRCPSPGSQRSPMAERGRHQ